MTCFTTAGAALASFSIHSDCQNERLNAEIQLFPSLSHLFCVIQAVRTLSNHLLLVFVAFCNSQLTDGASAARVLRVPACFQFERLLIFMSNVFNSPDAGGTRFPGETRPLFSLSTCTQRPPCRRGRRLCSPGPAAATVAPAL